MICGIIIYFPEFDRLKNNIDRLRKRNLNIVFFVNGCTERCLDYLNNIEDSIVLTENKNVGMATALNKIFIYAKSIGAKWVLTFDQDSIISDDFLLAIRKKMSYAENNLACICPKIVDNRRIFPANKSVQYFGSEEYVNMCITSGSCTRVEAWDQIGGFDDYLFIDLVDNDFCKRLISFGWRILRLNNVELDQQFGEIKPKNEKVVKGIKFICTHLNNQRLSANIAKLAYKKKYHL